MTSTSNIIAETRHFLDAARPPRVRSMRHFAEQEVIIPDGPYQGRKFKSDRQPYAGILLDAIDSNQWDHINATGPTQSGKTLICSIVPTLYHLFEVQETMIFGVPDLDMAGDKWREDILPALDRTRFKKHKPTQGAGSRGGSVKSAVKFKNGATLRFMAGGGGDKQRAAFTARVLVITESDGLDEPGRGSLESSKIRQLFGRTRSFSERTGRPARRYTECTVTTEQGFTWRTHRAGTESRLALPCPYCAEWVTPGRDHLVGWQDAPTELDAMEGATFVCPSCEKPWTEADRTDANAAAVLVHRGQTLDKRGNVEGDPPRTRILGFRWSSVNNLLISAADVASDEWKAREEGSDDADRELCQFVWAVPPAPIDTPVTALTSREVQKRQARLPRGMAPVGTRHVTVGVDVGKYNLHYAILAWSPDGTHIPTYGIVDVHSDHVDVFRSTMTGLRELRDVLESGWPMAETGEHIGMSECWIDCGWADSAPAVFQFCRDAAKAEGLRPGRARFRPVKGYGMGQERRNYSRPRSTGNIVRKLGEHYHFVHHKEQEFILVEMDANYWKSRTHERFVLPASDPGALTLFSAPMAEHTKFAKHMVSEKQVEKYDPGKGTVRVWERVSRANHWFDAMSLAMAAGHFVGERPPGQTVKETPPRPPAGSPQARRPAFTTPDGRPFFVGDRED